MLSTLWNRTTLTIFGVSALSCGLAAGLGGSLAGCGPKTEAKEPSTPATEADAGATEEADGAVAAAKPDECSAFEIASLEDTLLKTSCEIPNPTADAQAKDLKGVLEVKGMASQSRIPAGGKTDIYVVFTNKGKTPLSLLFRIDPLPRFDVETYDKKSAKRVDAPAGDPPPLPEGAAPRGPGEPHTARITLAPNGSAKAKVPWEAVKMKWAPEKVRGTPPEKGYPKTASGPLPKGVYVVQVSTPLIGVFEGADKELSSVKVDVEVTKP